MDIMKKILYIIVLSSLAIYILIFPQAAIKAASFGLVLWYSKMLPTLLPFAILSYIFVTMGILNSFTNILHKFIRPFLPISAAGIYPLIAGFLFGFPLGSRITAQMVEQGQLDYEEGCRLFAICNNISPVFVNGFILTTCLKRTDLNAVTLMILYAPPLLFFCIETWITVRKSKTHSDYKKNAASRSQINFKIIDAGIMSGFETLTRLGGYIMMFAILAQMTTIIPFPSDLPNCVLTGFIEITNGIHRISSAALPFKTKYLLIVTCTAFGGLSGLAQTASMTKAVRFPMKKYVMTKMICSLASAILAWLYSISVSS